MDLPIEPRSDAYTEDDPFNHADRYDEDDSLLDVCISCGGYDGEHLHECDGVN